MTTPHGSESGRKPHRRPQHALCRPEAQAAWLVTVRKGATRPAALVGPGLASNRPSATIAAHEIRTAQVGDAKDEGHEAVAFVVVAMFRMRAGFVPWEPRWQFVGGQRPIDNRDGD